MNTKLKIEKQVIDLFGKQSRSQLKAAVSFMKDLTQDKTRKNADPLILHNLNVAINTFDLGLGPKSVTAAILHNAL